MRIESAEHELIRACINGDAKAQRSLFDAFKGRLMTVCRRYARDASEAEDLLMMAFNRIFRYLPKYRGEGNFISWSNRVTINVCLRYLEKNKRHFYHEDVQNQHNMRSDRVTALDQLAEEEILNLIQEMPDGYQTVFNMYVIDGYSHKEIGEKLSVTSTTSRSQLYKARRWLREQLSSQNKMRI